MNDLVTEHDDGSGDAPLGSTVARFGLSRRSALGVLLSTFAAAGGLSLLMPLNVAVAADFPNKPIRIIVAAGAGNLTDSTARVVAESMERRIGQPVVVENRPGANGLIGMNAVLEAPADGYTITFGSMVNQSKLFIKASPIDLSKDFTPIVQLLTFSSGVVSNANIPPKTFNELVDYIKANPGKVKLGLGASFGKLFAYSLGKRTGVPFITIPYKTTPEAAQAAAAGEVDFAQLPIQTAQPFIDDKKLIPIAVTGSARSPTTPDIPSFGEMGYPELILEYQMYAVAPTNTPPAVIEVLNRELSAALRDEGVAKKLRSFNTQAAPAETPADARASYQKMWTNWVKITTDAQFIPE